MEVAVVVAVPDGVAEDPLTASVPFALVYLPVYLAVETPFPFLHSEGVGAESRKVISAHWFLGEGELGNDVMGDGRRSRRVEGKGSTNVV